MRNLTDIVDPQPGHCAGGGIPRRDILAGFAALGSLLTGGGPMILSACSPVDPAAGQAASPGFLDMVADIVIPATRTPGARTVHVGDFMERAFRHGLFGADAQTGYALERALRKWVPHGNFMMARPEDRIAAIRALDADSFRQLVAPPPPDAPPDTRHVRSLAPPPEPDARHLWRIAKSAIIVGYYMSEPGASQELRYEIVPGRYDPDIPYRHADSYLSNNWNANNG